MSSFIFKTNITFDLKHGKLNAIFSLLAFAIWVVYFDFHFSPCYGYSEVLWNVQNKGKVTFVKWMESIVMPQTISSAGLIFLRLIYNERLKSREPRNLGSAHHSKLFHFLEGEGREQGLRNGTFNSSKEGISIFPKILNKCLLILCNNTQCQLLSHG